MGGEGDGCTDLTLLSQSRSSFQGIWRMGSVGRGAAFRALCLGEGEDVACRAEVESENACGSFECHHPLRGDVSGVCVQSHCLASGHSWCVSVRTGRDLSLEVRSSLQR